MDHTAPTSSLLFLLSLPLLVLLRVGGGDADNVPGCDVMVVKENSTLTLPPRYTLTNTPVLITLPPLDNPSSLQPSDQSFTSSSSSSTFSNLDFIFSTELESLEVKLLNLSTVRCQKIDSQEPNVQEIGGLHMGDGGWWKSVEVRMEKNRVVIGGVKMCGLLKGTNPTLSGITASRQTIVAVNCGHDCLELSDTAIKALYSLPIHTAVHLRPNSIENSRILFRESILCRSHHGNNVCEELLYHLEQNQLGLELRASRSELERQWQRLLVILETQSNQRRDHSWTRHKYEECETQLPGKTIVVLAGSKVKAFTIESSRPYRNSYPFGSYFFRTEVQLNKTLSVSESVGITWAIGCPESHFDQIHHTTTEATSMGDDWYDVWMILALLSIVSFLALLFALCLFMAVYQRRKLEKRTVNSNIKGQHQSDSEDQRQTQQLKYYTQQSHLQASATITNTPDTDDSEGKYYTILDLALINKRT
ncbi:hypothetical protein Pmani_031955 [Petrolisthes manimaculis]|uniref:Uncharacterized protein n=1 Tax=Petrolisthes manimaculis TaxID=1843537 RepID=A0AAE1NUQ1_9EUCA|nr:hypothetical protein Pmani_031955 [Petrolisthes manimaculis]